MLILIQFTIINNKIDINTLFNNCMFKDKQ